MPPLERPQLKTDPEFNLKALRLDGLPESVTRRVPFDALEDVPAVGVAPLLLAIQRLQPVLPLV